MVPSNRPRIFSTFSTIHLHNHTLTTEQVLLNTPRNITNCYLEHLSVLKSTCSEQTLQQDNIMVMWLAQLLQYLGDFRFHCWPRHQLSYISWSYSVLPRNTGRHLRLGQNHLLSYSTQPAIHHTSYNFILQNPRNRMLHQINILTCYLSPSIHCP